MDTMEDVACAAAALIDKVERLNALGRDFSDILASIGDDAGFLGSVVPGWDDPGPPPPSDIPSVGPETKATFVALQRCIMDTRKSAQAQDERVLETEGWGNTEWALQRLTLLTDEPWQEDDDRPAAIMRAATEALMREDLTEEAFLRDFVEEGAPFGYHRLFHAMDAVRDSDPDPLLLLEPLLKAMRLHAKQVKSGMLPESWLVHVLLEDLEDDVKMLRK